MEHELEQEQVTIWQCPQEVRGTPLGGEPRQGGNPRTMFSRMLPTLGHRGPGRAAEQEATPLPTVSHASHASPHCIIHQECQETTRILPAFTDFSRICPIYQGFTRIFQQSCSMVVPVEFQKVRKIGQTGKNGVGSRRRTITRDYQGIQREP